VRWGLYSNLAHQFCDFQTCSYGPYQSYDKKYPCFGIQKSTKRQGNGIVTSIRLQKNMYKNSYLKSFVGDASFTDAGGPGSVFVSFCMLDFMGQHENWPLIWNFNSDFALALCRLKEILAARFLLNRC
jgi:hypothetical protein